MAFGTPFDNEGETVWSFSIEDTTSGVFLGFTSKTNSSQWATKGDTAVKAAFQKLVTALDGHADLVVHGGAQTFPRGSEVTP